MMWVLFLIAMQVVVAAMIFFILKLRLGKELMRSALEKLHGVAVPAGAQVKVVTAEPLGDAGEAHFRGVIARRSPEAVITFEQDAALQGGVVLEWPGQRLDFSVAGRWKNVWS